MCACVCSKYVLLNILRAGDTKASFFELKNVLMWLEKPVEGQGCLFSSLTNLCSQVKHQIFIISVSN
jgi:hypothetical protein